MFSHFVFILCVHSVTPCGFLFCVLLLLFIFFFIYFIISLRIKCITYSVHNVYVMMLMFSEIVAATRAFAWYAENMIVSCARYKLSRLQLSLGALKPNVSRLLRLSSLVDRARARVHLPTQQTTHTHILWLTQRFVSKIGWKVLTIGMAFREPNWQLRWQQWRSQQSTLANNKLRNGWWSFIWKYLWISLFKFMINDHCHESFFLLLLLFFSANLCTTHAHTTNIQI